MRFDESQGTRIGVAALHVCLADRIPYVGIQWPAKAAACGECNLSTIQGGVEWFDPSKKAAMCREFSEEYGIDDAHIIAELFSVLHSSRGQTKQLTVFCVETGWRVTPNPEEVAHFGWCEANSFSCALQAMSQQKQWLMLQALEASLAFEPRLEVFAPLLR